MEASQRTVPRIRTRTNSKAASQLFPEVKEPLLGSAKPQKLLEWSELATWRQLGSEHLQIGYRHDPETLLACFYSWAYIHNEFVNIHSHVLGMLVFLILLYSILYIDLIVPLGDGTTSDVLVCSIYIAGVAVCFALSTVFHTVMHLSQQTYDFGIKLDYFGIILLMWGSTFPLIHYSFPCQTSMQVTYLTVITLLGGLCTLATFHPSIGGPHLGHIRAILFGSFGFGAFLVPISHGLFLFGVEEQSQRIGLPWIGLTVLFNATGVIAYALKFPEFYHPRKFDLFGASHQIMHIMVVLAALSYARAVTLAFHYAQSAGNKC